MKKSKIVKRCILITVLSAVLVLGAMFAHYWFTTKSYNDCLEYCKQNSERKAEKFEVIKDGNYLKDYIYLTAADGDSSKAQEMFIFKETYFGFINLKRYKFVMSSTESTGGTTNTNKFGAVQFFATNDKGEKDTSPTLVFFGSTRDSDICAYEYTLTVREGSNVYKGYIRNGNSTWFLKFYGMENTDEVTKRIVSDVKFYDSEGNLVGVY